MKNIGNIIRDVFIFYILLLLFNFALSEYRGIDKNTLELLSFAGLTISTILYAFLANRTHKISIFYGVLVAVLLAFALGSKNIGANWFIIILIVVISIIYNNIKENNLKKS